MNGKVIRIFVSSTFMEFETERDVLNRTVFAELEERCQAEGISFHVIDLRWGISQQNAQDNKSLEICFEEIRRCQEASPYVNFLVMAGDRYGWIPLPGMIPKEEWQSLTRDLRAEERAFVSHWYPEDANTLQCNRILRSRPTEQSDAEWEDVQQRLKGILFPQAAKHLKPELRISYGLSATEQEIYRGLFHQTLNRQARDNTLILLKSGGDTTDEGAQMLRKKFLRGLSVNGKRMRFKSDQIYSYTGQDGYMEKTRAFLTRVVEEQIASINREETAVHGLQSSLDRIADRYIGRPEVEAQLDTFLQGAGGKVVTVHGISGSGKTTILKNWYRNHSRNAAACFSDTMPQGKSVLYAISNCFTQLAEKGLIPQPTDTPTYENCVQWVQKHCVKLYTKQPITLILDSVDEMTDWHLLKESLFSLELPQQVTVVISSIGRESFLQRDYAAGSPEALTIPLIRQRVALDWLLEFLRKRGRCLSDVQLRDIAGCLPWEVSPLYLELLGIICLELKSYQTWTQQLPVTAEALAGDLFAQQAKAYYPTLFYHSLGYLSLLREGLSETELLQLQSADPKIRAEITREEQLNQTSGCWDATSRNIPSALWARLYCTLNEFLLQREVDGVITISPRHGLLRKAALDLLTEEERLALVRQVKAYFERLPWYYSANAQVNTRKMDVLYQLLRTYGPLEDLGDLLATPEYAQAMLSAGLYDRYLDHLIYYRDAYGKSAIHESISQLLKQKVTIFRVWPESFLANAISSGIWDMPLPEDSWRIEPDNPETEKRVFVPDCYRADARAFRKDGIVALLHNGVVSLYDLQEQRSLDVSCHVRGLQRNWWTILFWKGDDLLLRTEYIRVTLHYDREEKQLYEVKRQIDGQSWLDYFQSEKKHPDTPEERYETERMLSARPLSDTNGWKQRWYQQGSLRKTVLPYKLTDDLSVCCYDHLAAILVNGRRIDLIDLRSGDSQLQWDYHGEYQIHWGEDGSRLYIVTRQNLVEVLDIHALMDVSVQSGSREKRPVVKQRDFISKGLSELYSLIPSFLEGAQFTMRFEREPLYAAFSVQRGWAAFYYRYQSKSIVVIGSLSDGRQLCWYETDPIYWRDTDKPVFYADRDGEVLVLLSGKKRHIWNSTTQQWSIERKDSRALRPPKPVERVLHTEYGTKLALILSNLESLPLLPKRQKGEPLHHYLLSFLVDIAGIGFFVLILLPLIVLIGRGPRHILSGPMDRKRGLRRLKNLRIQHSQGLYWSLDVENRIFTLCNQAGEVLCREQFPFAILSGDLVQTGAGQCVLHLLTDTSCRVLKYHLTCGENGVCAPVIPDGREGRVENHAKG